MYPILDKPQQSPLVYSNKSPALSQKISDAIQDLQKGGFALTSMRPHLNYHECFFSIVIPNKMSVSARVVFLRNYPAESPILYATGRWLQHQLIRPFTNEVDYTSIFQWSEGSRLVELITKVQGEFVKCPPIDKSDIDKGYVELEDYQRKVESLKSKPNVQPPPPPKINLENVLKTFYIQENLRDQCESKEALYQITAQEYAENIARIRCISERFSKGKILRELEKQLESQMGDTENMKIDDLMKKYYDTRKQYHRTKILKQLYEDQ